MSAEAVVFAKGEYLCRSTHGTARVVVPRNIHLSEIKHALAELFEGRADAARTKNAPHVPTKA